MARPTLPSPVLAKEGNQMMGKKWNRRTSDKSTMRVRVCSAGDDGGSRRHSRLEKEKKNLGKLGQPRKKN